VNVLNGLNGLNGFERCELHVHYLLKNTARESSARYVHILKTKVVIILNVQTYILLWRYL